MEEKGEQRASEMGGNIICWLQAVRSLRGSQGARNGVGRSSGLWRECDRWRERVLERVGGSEGEEGQLEVEGGWGMALSRRLSSG